MAEEVSANDAVSGIVVIVVPVVVAVVVMLAVEEVVRVVLVVSVMFDSIIPILFKISESSWISNGRLKLKK